MLNKTLLGSAAVIMTMVGAQAADLPSKKAAPATYVKICDAYGAGFFYIPGTDTCAKIGGRLRVDYDYRPERDKVLTPTAVATGTGLNTTGFYSRGNITLDTRTASSYGVVRTFTNFRGESGSGQLRQDGAIAFSLEAAFIQFAGFTFGQAAQPFAFLSPWSYNTSYTTGWPNGVRQLTYTATLGGGWSATVGVTDVQGGGGPGYNQVAGQAATPKTADENFGVYVGNVRYDQSWGSAQVMAAWHSGGSVTVNAAGVPQSGYAIGGGISFKLPMLAAGDELQLTAVYADRIGNFLTGEGVLNTPSAGAYGVAPLGGPGVDLANGAGYNIAGQFRHFWTKDIRSEVYGGYVSRDMALVAGAKATAWNAGHALIWTPVPNFDIGLQVNYLRATYNQTAARTIAGYAAQNGDASASNFVTKLRLERNF